MFAAPGFGSTPSSTASNVPAPDDRLAEPETRYEVIDGERVYVSPADEPHGTEHFGLGYVLAAHVAPGYCGAVDMLTRTSETSDYAPDASIYPEARDPKTGGRKLEELAFEVASTQSRASATRKARGLAERGVRRVFCLWLPRGTALEWNAELDDWRALAPNSVIVDVCLVRPLPVAALLNAAVRDDEVARALLAKRNPVLMSELAEQSAKGEARGRAEAVIRVIEARGLTVPSELRARLTACADLDELDRWITRAATARSSDELVEDDGE